jgi:hypothetical protein
VKRSYRDKSMTCESKIPVGFRFITKAFANSFSVFSVSSVVKNGFSLSKLS